MGLSRHLARENLPVVLVGGERVVGDFLRLTRNGARIAGMACGSTPARHWLNWKTSAAA